MKKIIVLIFLSLVIYNYCSISSSLPYSKEIFETQLFPKGYVSNYFILIDYSKPSCEDRLYICNIDDEGVDNNGVIYSGAVLHGKGGNSTTRKPQFSNKLGSKCSSLGVFKTAEFGKMSNGLPCIKLDGLSDTNSNVRKRGIYIHPSALVTALPFEIKGLSFPLTNASEGCITVSWHTFNKIKHLIQRNNEPIYIYAYT